AGPWKGQQGCNSSVRVGFTRQTPSAVRVIRIQHARQSVRSLVQRVRRAARLYIRFALGASKEPRRFDKPPAVSGDLRGRTHARPRSSVVEKGLVELLGVADAGVEILQ